MAAVLRVVFMMGLGIVVPLVLQRFLLARLPTERRERGWNGASWASALYAFGPLSMLGFSWVTRRRGGFLLDVLGLLMGVVWVVALVAALSGLDFIFCKVFGVKFD